MKASTYRPLYPPEQWRLRIQAERLLPWDLQMLRAGLQHRGVDQQWSLLDLGCADGWATLEYLKAIPELSQVIGVDKYLTKEYLQELRPTSHELNARWPENQNSFIIGEYQQTPLQTRPSLFHELDLESDDMEERLRDVLSQAGLEQADIIVAANVLHHLADPTRLMKRLKPFLAPGGFLYIRSKDDGCKQITNDDGLAQELISLTHTSPGVADRFFGRKLIDVLEAAGWKGIQPCTQTFSTTGMNALLRENFFLESFSFRRNYWLLQTEQHPNDEHAQQQLATIDERLAQLRERFIKDDVYYAESSLGALVFP